MIVKFMLKACISAPLFGLPYYCDDS